jgi:hypothetical protein
VLSRRPLVLALFVICCIRRISASGAHTLSVVSSPSSVDWAFRFSLTQAISLRIVSVLLRFVCVHVCFSASVRLSVVRRLVFVRVYHQLREYYYLLCCCFSLIMCLVVGLLCALVPCALFSICSHSLQLCKSGVLIN